MTMPEFSEGLRVIRRPSPSQENTEPPSPEPIDFSADENLPEENPPEPPLNENEDEESDDLFWQRMMFYMVYLELKKPDIRPGLIAGALEQLRQHGKDWQAVLRVAERLSGNALNPEQRAEVYELMREFESNAGSGELEPPISEEESVPEESPPEEPDSTPSPESPA